MELSNAREISMDQITLPIFDWFVGETYRKTGNCFTGSVGFTSISNNAFCYRAWLERGEDGVFLKGETYDILTKNEADKHDSASFAGNPQGREELLVWLGERYQAYLDQKRNEMTASFQS